MFRTTFTQCAEKDAGAAVAIKRGRARERAELTEPHSPAFTNDDSESRFGSVRIWGVLEGVVAVLANPYRDGMSCPIDSDARTCGLCKATLHTNLTPTHILW
jgi:hypothetical protein